MRLRTASPAAAIITLFASAVSMGNPDWSAGYPQPGSSSGSIAVAGTITLDSFLTTTGNVYVAVWPVGGGVQTTTTFTISSGQTGTIDWGSFTVTGLGRNQQYNVYTQIEAVDSGLNTQELTTDPAITYSAR
jgi:hypothetical protein